jgi:hypothetical protein
VLLLVVQAELHDLAHGGVGPALEERQHPSVHVAAVGHHLGERRAREKPALGTRIRVAEALVVGVEERAELRLEGPVARSALEHQGLEEPAGVGQVPFHGARVGHGLERAVLGR